MHARPASGVFALVLTVTLFAACAPPATPAPAPGAAPASEASARGPKALTIGIQREPPSFNDYLTQGGSTSGGATQVFSIAHDYLVVNADRANGHWEPHLAQEVVSLDKGSWRVNADGSMETIWRLRPNIRWQDGTPFTSDDLLFTFNVYKDPEVPNAVGAALARMESASAPDPQTFIVRWSSVYVRANEAPGLIPIPRHLVEETYRSDPANLANSTRFSTEFIGLGPYRLIEWEPGVRMQFTRFEQYHLSRPPLDTVHVRFIADVSTLVANILAGSIDVILPTGPDVDTAFELQQRWAGTGNQVLMFPSGGLRNLEIQHRAEYELARNTLTNRTVRQALYHAIERPTLPEVLQHDAGTVADSWIPPRHELRPQVESAIPQFPYDLRRAQELLAQAGWVRGPDGLLVAQATGERFEVQVHGQQGPRIEREMALIAEGWKALGAQVREYAVPSALLGSREAQAKIPGARLSGGYGYDDLVTDRLHSNTIASEATRWNGKNRGGYVNPRVDTILDQLNVTIAPAQRVTLHRALLQEQMGDVALMPLYWQIDPAMAVRAVKGFFIRTENFYQWDKEA